MTGLQGLPNPALPNPLSPPGGQGAVPPVPNNIEAILRNQNRLHRGNPSPSHGGIDVGLVSNQTDNTVTPQSHSHLSVHQFASMTI